VEVLQVMFVGVDDFEMWHFLYYRRTLNRY